MANCQFVVPEPKPEPKPQPAVLYQLAFRTPGISPFKAICRKQILHIPNFLRNARGRPQRWQRLTLRDENFGFALALMISAFFAISL
jgi:hypothetical protein